MHRTGCSNERTCPTTKQSYATEATGSERRTTCENEVAAITRTGAITSGELKTTAFENTETITRCKSETSALSSDGCGVSEVYIEITAVS